jgi:hypothetical protein
MTPYAWASVLFVFLCGAATAGSYVRLRLPERHRSHEAMELVGVAISLLVTFTSIVLGLLTGEVTSEFDQASKNDGAFASQLVQIDQCMRDFGLGADAMREELRSYVATVIATTWPNEAPPPGGIAYPSIASQPIVGEIAPLTVLLNKIHNELRALTPKNEFQQNVVSDCKSKFATFLGTRWNIIEESNSSISPPFYGVLGIWLMILFASFGLTARPSPITIIVVALTGLSIAIAVGVIADLDQPYGGIFGISSDATRNALSDMLRN